MSFEVGVLDCARPGKKTRWAFLLNRSEIAEDADMIHEHTVNFVK